MKKIISATALATVLVLGLPSRAWAFNPQPDPPGYVLVNLSISPVVSSPLHVGVLVNVIPPGPCTIAVSILFPPDPCTPPPVGGPS